MVGHRVGRVSAGHRTEVEAVEFVLGSDLEEVVLGEEEPAVRVPQVDDKGVVVVASQQV